MARNWSRRLDTADVIALTVLALAGLSLWIWAEGRGDGEAWDIDVFWSVVLPIMALASALAGGLRPDVARFAGLALVVPQAIALFSSSGFAPLALVGVLFFVIFAVVFTGIALIAANLRNRIRPHH